MRSWVLKNCRFAQAITLDPSGNLEIKDLDSLPISIWEKINNYMSERGYDWRGPEDAKAIFKRLLQRMGNTWNKSAFPDHINAIVQALGLSAKPKKKTSISPGLMNKLVETFGLTNNLKEAGYILPDGSLLDFSGKNEGGQFGTRARDHREIGRATGEGGTEGMIDFILKGAIRFMPETGDLHIGKLPTEQQFRRIIEILRQYNIRENGAYITLMREAGVAKDLNYEIGTNPAQVVNDIRKFYGVSALAWVRNNCRFAQLTDSSGFPISIRSLAQDYWLSLSPEKRLEIMNKCPKPKSLIERLRACHQYVIDNVPEFKDYVRENTKIIPTS